MEPHIGQYYKITIIGDGAVGKTSIIEYLLGREFHSTYLLTIGANIATYPYTSSSGQLFRYQFWDLAGQRRFDLVRGPFYKGSRACIMVFDVTRPLSMENLKLWREELHTNAGPDVPFIVLGNKCDLPLRKELKEQLLNTFSGKMENRQAFIMQFIMEIAQKGEKPPSRDQIDDIINKLISEGTIESKGDLLILKTEKRISSNSDEEEEEIEIVKPLREFDEHESMILSAFQGKFEKKTAIVMNATMKAISKGNSPPDKLKLEEAISHLIDKGILSENNNLLIKNK